MRIPKAAELLAARLRRDILGGRLKAGQTLPSEARLLEAVGVGRPALREAQRILESEGLLQVQRGARGGAIVTLPDPAIVANSAGLWLQYNSVTLRDVYDSRALLEAAAAERLADMASAPEHALLRELIDEEQRGFDNREQWFEASLNFHTRLVELTQLASVHRLSQMLGEITARHISRQRRIVDDKWLPKARRSTKAHSKLMSLIEARQGPQAKEFWLLHMEQAGLLLFQDHDTETVLDLFEEGSKESPPSNRTMKAAEVLADSLRRQIVHGELAEGQILPPETQLADTMGVGRPALREALRILESESLLVVERGSRGGARVQPPSPAAAARSLGVLLQLAGTTIEDLYETRMIIEPAAARAVAERASADSLIALRRLAEEGRALLDRPDEWVKHAIRFHAAVVALSGLETLSYLGGLIENIIDRHWSNSYMQHVSRPEAMPAAMSHRTQMRLISLIEAKDGRGAEATWRTHLEGIQQRLIARPEGLTTLNLAD
jgi:GntR family transcriptional repressor for pyruvate dehydrogenase complex